MESQQRSAEAEQLNLFYVAGFSGVAFPIEQEVAGQLEGIQFGFRYCPNCC